MSEDFAARRGCGTEKRQGAIISRVLSPQAVSLRTGLRWQPFICSPDCSGALAANPGRSGRNTPTHLAMGARPLFGLAPGGVCHADPVASAPVRSYRTLSPLPVPASGPSAVCSLWHFPLRPRRSAGGRYPPPLFRGARTFLAPPKEHAAASGPLTRRPIGPQTEVGNPQPATASAPDRGRAAIATGSRRSHRPAHQ